MLICDDPPRRVVRPSHHRGRSLPPTRSTTYEPEGRAWRILHTGAILSHADEERFLGGDQPRVPYGIVLWPAAIALAHEIATRALRGTRVLELGAGTGLPGIVAASLGARVVQTDRQDVAPYVCKLNAQRNGVTVDRAPRGGLDGVG